MIGFIEQMFIHVEKSNFQLKIMFLMYELNT